MILHIVEMEDPCVNFIFKTDGGGGRGESQVLDIAYSRAVNRYQIALISDPIELYNLSICLTQNSRSILSLFLSQC